MGPFEVTGRVWQERLWSEREELVRRAKLAERMLFALADAASGLRVTNASYRKAAEVTEGTGGRDLRQLVVLGYLEAHGERRGRFDRMVYRVEGDELQIAQVRFHY